MFKEWARRIFGRKEIPSVNLSNPTDKPSVQNEEMEGTLLGQALNKAYAILSAQGYEPTDNPYARESYFVCQVFKNGTAVAGDCYDTFFKMASNGNMQFVIFIGAGEFTIDDCKLVEFSATAKNIKEQSIPMLDFLDVGLQDFLDKIGTEPVADFFAGMRRGKLSADKKPNAPQPHG